MRTIIFALLLICPPAIKPFILRVYCGARIGRSVYIGWFASVMGRHIAIGDYSEIRSLTLVRCDGDINIGSYSLVSSFTLIYGAANLIIGNHSYIGPQSLLNNDEDIRIGNYSALGARCMVYTHGSFLPYTEGYWVKFGKVVIGSYVWCAAAVFIHPGVEIGDNVFVNSKSVVTQSIPAGDVAEGFPAKRVTTMDKVKRAMTPRRVDAAIGHMLKHFVELTLCQGMELQVQDDGNGSISFTYHNQEYLIQCVTSQQSAPLVPPATATRRVILLVNRRDWSPPAPLDGAMIFNMITMQMQQRHDHIYRELSLFMKRYYGVQFEYA